VFCAPQADKSAVAASGWYKPSSSGAGVAGEGDDVKLAVGPREPKEEYEGGDKGAVAGSGWYAADHGGARGEEEDKGAVAASGWYAPGGAGVQGGDGEGDTRRPVKAAQLGQEGEKGAVAGSGWYAGSSGGATGEGEADKKESAGFVGNSGAVGEARGPDGGA
jgi:hypothetical protein